MSTSRKHTMSHVKHHNHPPTSYCPRCGADVGPLQMFLGILCWVCGWPREGLP